MKIRFAILATLVFVLATSAFGQNYSLNLDLTFDTKYVFRGQQLADNVFTVDRVRSGRFLFGSMGIATARKSWLA